MTQLIRKPIYPIKNSICNNRNVHEYTPYVIINGENVIDLKWWESLSDYCKSIICERTNNNFKLDNVIIPHDFQFDNENKFLTIMYKCYIDSFDYNIWYSYLETNQVINTPQNVILIPISTELKRIFVELYKSNEKYSDDINDEELKQFKNNIEMQMDNNTQYFIRLSSTSGKNEKSVKPFSNACEIISHIASVKLFVEQEYNRENKESYLILMPWNNNINDKYEFRIFVVGNKLTAISQQNARKLYHYSSEELDIIEYALNNITFVKSVPYKTYVGDVYININTQTCHLIELNPYGAHSGAGAALFNWIDDYNVLHGTQNDLAPEFRYLSIINY